MKKTLMMGAGAAALSLTFSVGYEATRAHAADLLPYTPPPPPPMWSWTGPYAGLHVGTLDGDVDGDIFFGKVSEASDGEVFDPNGILGGVQAGYNFQFDSIVLGLEGDVSFGDIDDVIYIFGIPGEAEIDWMATVRGRVGWAWDRTLFYATGGIAFSELEITFESDESDGNSMFGWTVGGGVEQAVTDSISLRAEYLYADFGKEDFGWYEGDLGGDYDLTTHTFRVGVTWLF